MCGIAGIWHFDSNNNINHDIGKMVDVLQHRGPDDNGIWTDGGLALGHTRLAILDLTHSGHQPMISTDCRYILVFNGEIYNYKTLASELKKENIQIDITGDTKVLLYSCIYFGIEKTLSKINGMFAFAFYDKQEKILTLARDRFGEKPLYYSYSEGRYFAFGSELKSLKSLQVFNDSIDEDALDLYLRFNYIPCPLTIYKNAKKLFPGNYITIKCNFFKKSCYYDLDKQFESREFISISDNELIECLDEKLQKSVRDRVEADVPVGAFLSGGIDSSLMCALMQSQSTTPIKTFTVGFKNSQFDESKYAENIARHLNTDHTTLYINPEEIFACAHSIIDIYDEPFGDASALSTYCISKLFKNFVTIAIGGDGGDELFLGYHRHKWVPLLNRLAKVTPNFLPKIAEKVFMRLLSSKNPVLCRKLTKAIRALAGNKFLDTYFNSVSYWQNNMTLENTWFKTNRGLSNNAEQVAFLDMRTFLHDDVLCKVDRASMATSLETRAPFLDYELVDFALSIPFKKKFPNGDKKHLLKKVLNRYVPKNLWDRPKMGFGMPLGDAFRTDLKQTMEYYLKADTIIWKHLDRKYVNNLFQQHLSSRINHENLLWNFFVAQQFCIK